MLFESLFSKKKVAPLAGAWIEMRIGEENVPPALSHPSRVRGLKSVLFCIPCIPPCRTPRGCVD